jgi:hypothetical protein
MGRPPAPALFCVEVSQMPISVRPRHAVGPLIGEEAGQPRPRVRTSVAGVTRRRNRNVLINMLCERPNDRVRTTILSHRSLNVLVDECRGEAKGTRNSDGQAAG